MGLLPEAEEHYNAGRESGRLNHGAGRLEFLRTLSVIERHLPGGGLHVLDVGGGAGPYSFALAREGHRVDLVDAMPLHIEQALGHPDSSLLASARVGDARSLDFADSSFDAVLLLGPLYHLVEAGDRCKALSEAYRVLKPGGVLFAAGISRLASLLDGHFHGLAADPVFQKIVAQDLIDGQHRNPTSHPAYFTTTKFHLPSELSEEVVGAGFAQVGLFGIEGFAWLLPALEPSSLEADSLLMQHLQTIEQESSIVGMSAHILAVARKE